MGEIAPEHYFTIVSYASKLGVRTLTRFYSTFLIFEGVVLSAPENTRAFEAPADSVALYEQALMMGLRFLVPLFFRELQFYLGLASGQLMPNT